MPCYVPPLEGHPFIESPGTSQSLSVSSYSDFSLPSPSALLATLPPTHPKKKGQRSTIDDSVLLHAFTDQSPHPDPRRRSLLNAFMNSPFYHEHQHEPRLDAIDAELFAILWDFPSFVVAPSKEQSIFSLFVEPGITRHYKSMHPLAPLPNMAYERKRARSDASKDKGTGTTTRSAPY
ncbi:hypothetical protein FRC17_003325 [Serendipita sp. 399]|nr:hypothetical protein FRC17_003325 [Serendipita sp. 399]